MDRKGWQSLLAMNSYTLGCANCACLMRSQSPADRSTSSVVAGFSYIEVLSHNNGLSCFLLRPGMSQ